MLLLVDVKIHLYVKQSEGFADGSIPSEKANYITLLYLYSSYIAILFYNCHSL